MSRDPSSVVSVVTPVYQGMPYLEECIESVRSQSYRDWEYVILDNASTDGSWERAREAAEADDRIRIHRNEHTVPFVENWNRALDLAAEESRYIKVVHADDWLQPDCIESMVDLAERNPGVTIVGGWVARGEEIMCRWDEAPGEVIPGRRVARLSLLGEIPYIFGSPTSILMRADAVRAEGTLYEEESNGIFSQVVDQDACYRLLSRGDFAYVRRVLTATREHEDSITARNEQLARWYAGKIALHLRYGAEFLEEDEHRAVLKDWLDQYYDFLGREVWAGRDREFWAYHRTALGELGFGLRPVRLTRAAVGHLVGRIGRAISRRLKRLAGMWPREETGATNEGT